MKNNSNKILLINAIIVVLGVLVDQIVKVLIEPLKDSNPIVIINNVLEITYLENRGAAFGIMQGQKIFFLVITIIVLAVLIYIFLKIPNDKKYIQLNICLSLTLAGAIGNCIDRVILGYVRDFIYFKIINFPVFNIADSYITVCMFWLVIMIVFIYKDEDLDFLKLKKRER